MDKLSIIIDVFSVSIVALSEVQFSTPMDSILIKFEGLLLLLFHGITQQLITLVMFKINAMSYKSIRFFLEVMNLSSL